MKTLMRIIISTALLALSACMNFATAQTPPIITAYVIGYAGTFMVADRPYVNGNYTLIFQSTDGNLVVYRGNQYTAANAVWKRTGLPGGKYAFIQEDGNFIIADNLGDASSVKWTTNTQSTVVAGQQSPYFGITSDGSFFVNGNNGKRFASPRDPQLPPLGGCSQGIKFPICIFPGSANPWTSFVIACDAKDAMNQASAMGAQYGACR